MSPLKTTKKMNRRKLVEQNNKIYEKELIKRRFLSDIRKSQNK